MKQQAAHGRGKKFSYIEKYGKKLYYRHIRGFK
jgi:hypothetical protein